VIPLAWKGLLKVKDTYLCGREVILNSGNLISFWLDPWLNDTPLASSHPDLFDIFQAQD
jgi:hypothetical protein